MVLLAVGLASSAPAGTPVGICSCGTNKPGAYRRLSRAGKEFSQTMDCQTTAPRHRRLRWKSNTSVTENGYFLAKKIAPA
mmetsp:Transcript_32064/g.46716  ORF Transcript_32064/g.46716 Transcript_32064/m.46716 type:complete len:80 (-) Transcript_32064:503-742(-)